MELAGLAGTTAALGCLTPMGECCRCAPRPSWRMQPCLADLYPGVPAVLVVGEEAVLS